MQLWRLLKEPAATALTLFGSGLVSVGGSRRKEDIAAVADISPRSGSPYGLLGGKVVSVLVATPEVISTYSGRYSGHPSVIASSLAGRPRVKVPHLVFLGATSLYGTEPTQYTRVKVPCDRLTGK